jgi:hypothetical protein
MRGCVCVYRSRVHHLSPANWTLTPSAHADGVRESPLGTLSDLLERWGTTCVFAGNHPLLAARACRLPWGCSRLEPQHRPPFNYTGVPKGLHSLAPTYFICHLNATFSSVLDSFASTNSYQTQTLLNVKRPD